MLKKLLILITLLFSTLTIFAEESKIILEVGLGAMYDSGIYKGDKNRVEPLPLINARYDRFAIEYDRAKCYINDDFALVVGMGNNGYDNIKGMDNRAMAITLGADYKIKLIDDLSTRIKINENFFGTKTGLSGELTLEKEFMPSENDMGSLSLGAKFIDDSLSDYYYGVKTSEATAVRKSYKGKATVIPSAGIDYIRIITPNIYFLLSSRGEIYLKEITNSPIVDTKASFNTIAGVVYKFM